MDLNYYRNNINAVGGINNFNRISNTKILILESNNFNENIFEIIQNLQFFNNNNIFYNKYDLTNYDFILIDSNNYLNQNNIYNISHNKYFIIPKEKNFFIISLILQSIIDNKKYDISKYINRKIKQQTKNILICGIGLICNQLISNNKLYNLYLYDEEKLNYYELINQYNFNIDDVNKEKIDKFNKNKFFNKQIFIFKDLDNNDNWNNIDYVINTIENTKLRKKINKKCEYLNIKCLDVGIEKTMGHIVPIIPYKTNNIEEEDYYREKEIPECKIENPETIEHCIEYVKRKDIKNINSFLNEMEIITKEKNINNITKYELENFFINKIPKLNSSCYYLIGLIYEYLFLNKIENIFFNLNNKLVINYIDNNLKKIKNEEFNNLYLSKIIVKKEFTCWDYINFECIFLIQLIDFLEKEYNGIIFTININDNLLYYNSNKSNNLNIKIIDLCNQKNIKVYNKNIVNAILTNNNNDTILVPKIYLTIPLNDLE